MMRAAVIGISFDLLREWLHLPNGVRVDAIVPSRDFASFVVRLRSDNDFLPEVPDGARVPRGMLVVTIHEPTVELTDIVWDEPSSLRYTFMQEEAVSS